VRVGALRSFNKNQEWVLVTGPFLGCLSVHYENCSLKSSPSLQGFCSQNWVLDRRWRGFGLDFFSESLLCLPC
jgi:hypothetical protein